MKAKTFFIAVLFCALALLLGTAAVVAWVDPLLTAGALEEGETALFVNERYEMAGLIRHQDYEDVVMGTSLVANYRASWFTQGTGRETLKITFPDGRLSEFDIALDLAFRTHGTLNTVYFCLDPNVLIREDKGVELPLYLYNDDPLDDLQLYLNGESLALAVKSLLRGDGAKVPLDEAFIWDGKYDFSWDSALGAYVRPEKVSEPLDDDAYLPTAQANIDVVCSWVEAHPDTQFKIWFPPYSILYWDKTQREGTTQAILSALEYAWGRLVAYENVVVYSFLNDRWTATDLGEYADHIHCSSKVTFQLAQGMIRGDWRIWPEYYRGQLDELRQYVTSYDYDAMFENVN